MRIGHFSMVDLFGLHVCAPQTLWENGSYTTPTAKRSLLRKVKAGKYQERLQSKAAYEASKPTESTYKVTIHLCPTW